MIQSIEHCFVWPHMSHGKHNWPQPSSFQCTKEAQCNNRACVTWQSTTKTFACHLCISLFPTDVDVSFVPVWHVVPSFVITTLGHQSLHFLFQGPEVIKMRLTLQLEHIGKLFIQKLGEHPHTLHLHQV